MGNVLINDYVVALNEKDLASQDYIHALNQYWISLQEIRYLTLYDFENNKNIEY